MTEKKAYTKPELKQVKLAVDEAVLQNCKVRILFENICQETSVSLTAGS